MLSAINACILLCLPSRANRAAASDPPPPPTATPNSQSPSAVPPSAPEPAVTPSMQSNTPNVVLLDCGHPDIEDDGNSSPNIDVSLCKLCRLKEDLENAAEFFDHELMMHGTGLLPHTKGARRLYRKARLALLKYHADHQTEGSSSEYDFPVAAELARKKGLGNEAEVVGAKKKKKGKKGKNKETAAAAAKAAKQRKDADVLGDEENEETGGVVLPGDAETTATRDDSTSNHSAAATTHNNNGMEDTSASSSSSYSVATQPSTSSTTRQLKSSLKPPSTTPKYHPNSRMTTFSPLASIEDPAFPTGYKHRDETEYRKAEMLSRSSEIYVPMQWATQTPPPEGASDDEKKDWGFWDTSGFGQEGWADWEPKVSPPDDQIKRGGGEENVAQLQDATGEQHGGRRQTRSMTKAAIESLGSESK